jgi:hypothetical protein
LVQDRGGAEFKTGGILLYVEDFKRGTNKEVGPKDIFEMGSTKTKGFDDADLCVCETCSGYSGDHQYRR